MNKVDVACYWIPNIDRLTVANVVTNCCLTLSSNLYIIITIDVKLSTTIRNIHILEKQPLRDHFT